MKNQQCLTTLHMEICRAACYPGSSVCSAELVPGGAKVAWHRGHCFLPAGYSCWLNWPRRSPPCAPSHVHIHPENGSPPSLCTPFHHNEERKPFWHLKCFCSCSLGTAVTALQRVMSATEGLSPKQGEKTGKFSKRGKRSRFLTLDATKHGVCQNMRGHSAIKTILQRERREGKPSSQCCKALRR